MNKLLEKAIAEVAALPEAEQEAVAARMLDEVKHRVPREGGKWAQVAARLAELDALRGKSARFERHTREFRDSFGLRGPSDA
jgi:predicted RNA polymerase sigma factor